MQADGTERSTLKRKAPDDELSDKSPSRIKALDQDVVNKIAAGEIIVAPVHAIKELTENAVDAGSTSVEILVRDGGLKLLQITDNGHGINRDDLPILCERFTTSKLKTFADLTSIGTYGFRGEALASISHIAHLQVTTKTRESSCAWRAHYSDGKLAPAKPGQSSDPKACAGRQGTQITVEDLFYNVPTRRRAFRSASEEYAKILDLVGRYAVHCAGVAFSCKKQGDASMGISVQASATTVERIRQIHGSSVANELIQFEASSERWGFKCSGWISSANYHAKKLAILLFINHRAVESSAIKRAVEQTYSNFLPKGGHPFVYLSLDIEPQRVDVNIHPTKREVNFLNEEEIIQLICEEIGAALGKVDTSRTFTAQSLLPGARVPTISANTQNDSTFLIKPTAPSPLPPKSAPRGLAAPKPYENNLVRTDAKVRKITSMLQTSQKPIVSPLTHDAMEVDDSDANAESGESQEDRLDYIYDDREPKICRLTSVKELRATVREAMHNGLTETFSSHTFVGVVDCRRRIVAIQAGVKLYLVDYGMISNEYFYQLGLTDFGNFGAIKLDPPLPLHSLLSIGAAQERDAAVRNGESDDLNWEEAVRTVQKHLISRRDMLCEYFTLDISEDGLVQSLPLLVKDYMPCMAKLPRFLLRLGPHVDWSDEKGCFRSFLRELASWYVPESLPPSPAPQSDPAGDSDMGDQKEDTSITKRREHVVQALENVLFPAFKARLIATKGMFAGVVEVADLKGLYRVFERC